MLEQEQFSRQRFPATNRGLGRKWLKTPVSGANALLFYMAVIY